MCAWSSGRRLFDVWDGSCGAAHDKSVYNVQCLLCSWLPGSCTLAPGRDLPICAGTARRHPRFIRPVRKLLGVAIKYRVTLLRRGTCKAGFAIADLAPGPQNDAAS